MHTTPVVLTPEQLQFLITDKQFENSLSIMLKKVKDIFVFGCTVGLRISDLMSLKKTNIITADGAVFLSVITKKTGAEVRIPLPDYIIEIINRNKRKSGKYLLPRLSGTNLNIQIKQLIKVAGCCSLAHCTV